MVWSLLVFCSAAFLLTGCQAQNFMAYQNVSEFDCADKGRLERISLNETCGDIFSPCYPDNYPTEVSNYFKIWDLNAITLSAPVTAYRFTIHKFETTPSGAFLDFGDRIVETESSNNVNEISRNFSITGQASVPPGVTIRNLVAGTSINRTEGETFDLDFTRLYLNFGSQRDFPALMGFNLSYCADYDRCDSSYSPSICANSTVGACVRNGFDSYQCNCSAGYNGSDCSNDIDECETNPCAENANCTNTAGSFVCVCDEGYNGTATSICVDIDECDTNTDNCHSNATCMDTDGSFNCMCNNGYTGNGTFCMNIDECETNTDNCHSNATCSDTDGSFNCMCDTGYTGNGTFCSDIDECTENTDNCHSNATCSDTDGSFSCMCDTGYTGNGTSCMNIDECAENTDNCHSNATCSDTDGSFNCMCDTGYTGNGTFCMNIDECATNTDNCHSNATCSDTEGSFDCMCNTGFSGNGTSCTDNNECDNVSDNDCAATGSTCTNTPGSFSCACASGYSGNGTFCEDVDECVVDSPCDSNANCTNNNGSFMCDCNPGYTGNGTSCSDVDECMTGDHNCSSTELRCDNTVGSFQCICDTPSYRGMPTDCDFYCVGNSTIENPTDCTIPGIIEWPLFHNGSFDYEINEVVGWFVNMTNQAEGNAIRFTFRNLNVSREQDYIIFTSSSNYRDTSRHIAVITGTLAAPFNNREPANDTNPNGWNSTTNSYTISGRSEIYVFFYSDRSNTTTGFVLEYVPDTDDCSSRPCRNGGMCTDGAFDFSCNCPANFTGKDCDTDIDECEQNTDDCHANAMCSNTRGSYNCTCNDSFSGNGTYCQPEIVVSNIMATTETGVVFITFDVTPAWRNNLDYVSTYNVTLTAADGSTITVTSELVNGTFMPIRVEPVENGLTNYNISISVGSSGTLFSPDYFSIDSADSDLSVTSAEVAPRIPANLTTNSSNEVRTIVTWVAPDESMRGTTTQYQIGVIRTTADCNRFSVISDPPPDCANETFYTINADQTVYTITGLQRYRNYAIRIRAATSAGYGEWSSNVTAFTGNICSEANDLTSITTCEYDQAAIQSESFPEEYTRFNDLYWRVDFSGKEGVKIMFDYFNTQQDQDHLDIIQGSDFTNPVFTTFDGDRTGRIEPITYTENSDNNGVVLFRFDPDLFVGAPGFQIHFITNASQCTDRPCLNNGTCNDLSFDFSCTCPSLWTGKICERQLVEIDAECSTTSNDSVTITWNVTERWANDESVIRGYTVSNGSSTNSHSIGTTSETFVGLSPYQSVSITVTIEAVNPASTPTSVTRVCRSQQAVPTQPRDVTATAQSPTIVRVTWNVPETVNGVVTEYTVTYVQTDADSYSEPAEPSQTTPANSREKTLTGLRVYRTYSIVVTATTGGGIGPESERVSVRTAEGVPGTVANVTGVPAARSITLTITPPTVTTGALQYEVEYTPMGGSTRTVTSDDTTVPLSGLTPYTNHSITVFARTGAGRSTTPFDVTVETLEAAPGSITPTLEAISSSSIRVTWSFPSEPNGMITGYAVRWTPGDGMENVNDGLTYDIPSLSAYTDYSVSVVARTSAGDGDPVSESIRTLEGAPEGPVQGASFTTTANSVIATITAPAVVTGVFSYVVTYTTPGGDSNTINSATETVNLPSLSPFTNYTINIVPRTSAGDGPSTAFNVQTDEDVPGRVVNLDFTETTYNSITVTWEPPTMLNGIIRYYNIISTPSTGVPIQLPATTSSYQLTSLQSSTSYRIYVLAATNAGFGNPMSIGVLTEDAIPVIVPGGVPVAPTGEQQLNGASPTTAYMIPNPCNRLESLFTRPTEIMAVVIIVKEASSNVNEPVPYSEAAGQRPTPPYVVGRASCLSSLRRKRQLTDDRQGFILGFDESCSNDATSTECNGPLIPGAQYQVSYIGVSSGGQSTRTDYGPVFSTATAEDSGLEPGEIAAIVVGCVVALLLIILIIIFFIRRKKQSGRHDVKKGSDNLSYDPNKQQKYKIDANEEQTAEPVYSVSSKRSVKA
ncbi:uncharacterized protein LOC143462746 isoform X1 [Clavelina lepadiformis]|uniref:uncharacterized protein LOC143462746 isoform X1 n=1 Tax=Clavelina lepadiformis TaxID=159417 RepID=UPI004042C762